MQKIILYFTVILATTIVTNFFIVLNNSYQEKKKESKQITIKEENEQTYNLELENYLIGVVACEMNASYHPEALKAQAIASRTFASYKMQESSNNFDILTTTSDQCYINESEMHKKWGNNYNKYYEIIKQAVEETKGIILNKNGKLFKSFYFSTSNGSTNDSQAVFQEGNITSVSSSWDKESKNYAVTIEFTSEELNQILGNFKNIQIVKRDTHNNVEIIKVDNKEYSGINFRKLLNLRSTDFIIEKSEDVYKITTYGYGHGVGMSQYGANYLANNGYDYQYILNYYYNNVDFVNY